MNKAERYQEQIELQEEIQRVANINVVTCGNCGSVMLHRIKSLSIDDDEKYITCPECNFNSEPCDFPDYNYEGMPVPDEVELVKEGLPSTDISIDDVTQVALDLKMNPTLAQLQEVLKYYDNEAKNSPFDTWELIVENILYNVIDNG